MNPLENLIKSSLSKIQSAFSQQQAKPYPIYQGPSLGQQIYSGINNSFKSMGTPVAQFAQQLPKNTSPAERFIKALPVAAQSVGNNFLGNGVLNAPFAYAGNRIVAPAASVPSEALTSVQDAKKGNHIGAVGHGVMAGLNTLYTAGNLANPVGTQIAMAPFTGFDAIKAAALAKRQGKDQLGPALQGITGKNVPGLGDVVTSNKKLATIVNFAEQAGMLAIPAVHGLRSKGLNAEEINLLKKNNMKGIMHHDDISFLDEILQRTGVDKQMNIADKKSVRTILSHYSDMGQKEINKLGDIQAMNKAIEIANQSEQYLQKFQGANLDFKLPKNKSDAAKKLPGIMFTTEKPGRRVKITNPLPEESYTKQGADQAAGQAQAMATSERKTFDDIMARLIGKRNASNTEGVRVASKFAGLPKEYGLDVIKAVEDPKKKVPTEIKSYIQNLRDQYNKLFDDARASGIKIGYLKDYITHIWDKPQAQVMQEYKAFKQKFGYSNTREVPTYEEGIKMGLVPKFTHPAEILNNYVRKLEEVKANVEAFKELRDNGFIVHAKVGYGRPGFMPIDAPGFPRSVAIGSDKRIIQGNWYAPVEIAQRFNQLFAPQGENAILKTIGNISSGVQDISLSGGFPGTPLNSFGGMQAIKEMMSGRVISPVTSMVRGMSENMSKEYFMKNIDSIKEMQQRTVPIPTPLNIGDFIGGSTIKQNFGEKTVGVWQKLVNEPTFKRFMPMLQLNLYMDARNALVKSGVEYNKAADMAAAAVKNFYGLKGTDVTAFNNKNVDNLIKTVFFAPRYRESMINFWINNIKALKDPLNPEYIQNSKFLLGATLTLLGMNYLNEKLNGHGMLQNPKGMEDQLLIPVGDRTIGIPFLSSIATVPRTIGKAAGHLIGGDLKQAGVDMRSTLSSTVKPLADIYSNQNYYGENIYNEADTPAEKYKKIGLYLTKSYNHPYISALIGYLQPGDSTKPKDTLPIAVSKALELPFRFYTSNQMESKIYFANKDEALKGLNAQQMTIYNKLHDGGIVDEDGLPVYNKRSEMANALDRLSNPQVLQAEAKMALMTAQQTGQPVNPFYQLTPKQQETVLTLKTFYPGDTNKSTITNANLSWLQPYWNARDQYTQYLKDTGVIKGDNGSYQQAPKPNELVQKKLDFYNTLPSGTGARSAFLRSNPDVLQFFNNSKAFTNTQRADLGLPLLASNSYGSSGFGIKVPKVGKVKVKKPKAATSKLSKFKVKGTKSSKVKTLKSKKYKFVAVKQPKIKVKIPKT